MGGGTVENEGLAIDIWLGSFGNDSRKNVY